MSESERALFTVTQHYELADRGAFLVGHLRGGPCQVGMIVTHGSSERTFSISAIEYLDNLPQRKSWNALVFKEKPNLEELKRLFPVGTVLEPRKPE